MRPADTHAASGMAVKAGRRSRAMSIVLGTVALASLAGVGGWTWKLHDDLHERDQRIQQLAAENRELVHLTSRERELEGTIQALGDTAKLQRSTIDRLMALHGTANSELLTLRERLADADRRRAQALAVVDRLVAEREKLHFAGSAVPSPRQPDAEQLSAALDRALQDRTTTELEVKALHAKTVALEETLDGLNQELGATKEHFKSWVYGHYGALRAVLKTSGVRVDPLVRRAEEKMAGEGGPFVPAPLRDDRGMAATLVPLPPELDADVRAVDVMRQLLVALPLGEPTPDAEQRSGFGLRRDPFTGRRAMHTGLDFAPGPTGKAFATAPGVVVWAAREGAYGKMVEVDHGFGLATRYAHLAKIEVKPGDHVEAGQELGVIGTTGRSTGRHLHYEVKVDGKAVDPADFLEARKRLADVLSQK